MRSCSHLETGAFGRDVVVVLPHDDCFCNLLSYNRGKKVLVYPLINGPHLFSASLALSQYHKALYNGLSVTNSHTYLYANG